MQIMNAYTMRSKHMPNPEEVPIKIIQKKSFKLFENVWTIKSNFKSKNGFNIYIEENEPINMK